MNPLVVSMALRIHAQQFPNKEIKCISFAYYSGDQVKTIMIDNIYYNHNLIEATMRLSQTPCP